MVHVVNSDLRGDILKFPLNDDWPSRVLPDTVICRNIQLAYAYHPFPLGLAISPLSFCHFNSFWDESCQWFFL